jgi:hypothetical protein
MSNNPFLLCATPRTSKSRHSEQGRADAESRPTAHANRDRRLTGRRFVFCPGKSPRFVAKVKTVEVMRSKPQMRF